MKGRLLLILMWSWLHCFAIPKENICRERDIIFELGKYVKKASIQQREFALKTKSGSYRRTLLRSLQNCSVYYGHIKITEESANNDIPGEEVGFRDFINLKHLRVIHGSLTLSLSKWPEFRDLYFLKELKEINTPPLSGLRGLIVNSSNLERLDFGNLRLNVPYVAILNNTMLCFLEKIHTINSSIIFEIKKNNDPVDCQDNGNVCSHLCNPEKGCWGRSQRNCFECRKWKIKDDCVDRCDSRLTFFTPRTYENRLCGECHEKCIHGCFGPRKAQCYAPPDPNYYCDWYKYYDPGENMCKECSRKCFGNSYEVRSRLKFRACTGPRDKAGRKGCTVACPATTFLSITEEGLFSCSPCLKECEFGCRNGTSEGCLLESEAGGRRVYYNYEIDDIIPSYVVWILAAIALVICGLLIATLRPDQSKEVKRTIEKFKNLMYKPIPRVPTVSK